MGNISGSATCDFSTTSDYSSPRQRRFTCKSTNLDRHYSITSQPREHLTSIGGPPTNDQTIGGIPSSLQSNNTSVFSNSTQIDNPQECLIQFTISQKLMSFLRFN